MMKKKYRKLNLLPFYFRNIGLGLLLLLLISVLVRFSAWNDFDFQPKYNILYEIVILVAFSFIALSENREEDERTLEIRTKVFSATLFMGVGYFIVNKMFHYFELFGVASELSAFQLLFTMFVFYFVFSFLLKRRG